MSNPEPGAVLEVGARLGDPPSAELIASAFAGELEGQRGLARAMGLADLAHTVMLVEGGIIPRGAGGQLLAALLSLHERPEELALDPALGDLYTNREAWLAARTPAVGWLGAGRARREATTIAFHLAVRARLLGLARALDHCGRALTRRATELRDALAPDYTYLQAAQPTSFGHTLLTFAPGILRDLERLRALFGRVDRSPAGCGSANGSRLPQDRRRLAELLGFGALVQHARDAMWQADLPIECLAVVVSALVNLDRLAEDLLFFSAAELGFVEVADAHARASKIMPHKKNPYALSYVRATANRMIGLLAGSAAAGRTPSGQIDNRLHAYGDVPRALAEATGAVELLAAVVEGLRFRADRAADCMARSFTAATDLAEVLAAETALDLRAAHRVVGLLARQLAETGRSPWTLSPADVAAAAERLHGQRVELAAETLARALDPADAVRARSGIGGAAPPAIDALVAECRAALAEHEAWRAAAAAQSAAAETALIARARELAGGD